MAAAMIMQSLRPRPEVGCCPTSPSRLGRQFRDVRLMLPCSQLKGVIIDRFELPENTTAAEQHTSVACFDRDRDGVS